MFRGLLAAFEDAKAAMRGNAKGSYSSDSGPTGGVSPVLRSVRDQSCMEQPVAEMALKGHFRF